MKYLGYIFLFFPFFLLFVIIAFGDSFTAAFTVLGLIIFIIFSVLLGLKLSTGIFD